LLSPIDEPLGDKTLVAWAAPANLDQRGGSVLTLEDGAGQFDAIVYGERAPRRWMAGSEMFHRTQADQEPNAQEDAALGKFVQVAIVNKGRHVALYRNGKPYADYELPAGANPPAFGAGTIVVAGMRHLDQGDAARFLGMVDDMRVYDRALSAEEIASLRPNERGPMAPWAWWPFEGSLEDRAGRFKAARVSGVAEVRDGNLRLYGGVFLAGSSVDELDRVLPAPPDPQLVDTIKRTRAFRHTLLADPDRPTYHFVIPEDFAMPFDPNGAIYWKGRYHLFYIYQDEGVHKFGHVSSLDMVHWRHHPPGLFPTSDSPEKGIFSGNCFVNKKGEATLVYHGVGAGNCMATSSDELLEHWTKLPTNPYLPNAPEGAPYRSWDPFGWLDGETYYTISGGERAAVFKANQLTDKWTYVGDLLHHTVPNVALREDISCADFFKLGGKDVLVCISHRLGTRYYVGEWKNEQFYPEVHERLSWADNLYFAPETLAAPDGRRVMWAWIFDQRRPAVRNASGWSGEMALPRQLSLGPDHKLRIAPVQELERLRYDEKTLGPFELAADSETPLPEISGDTYELSIEIEPKQAAQVGVVVRRSPGAEEAMPVMIDAAEHVLRVGNEAGPFDVQGKTVTLRVFVDRSVVEAFADDRQAVVRRMYPRRKDSLGVALVCKGGPAVVRRVVAWKMFPANPY
jgi:sucrose-6-phosphate hydrolase SacC (GH32 family)